MLQVLLNEHDLVSRVCILCDHALHSSKLCHFEDMHRLRHVEWHHTLRHFMNVFLLR